MYNKKFIIAALLVDILCLVTLIYTFVNTIHYNQKFDEMQTQINSANEKIDSLTKIPYEPNDSIVK